jgi:thiol-disulfide isomerase/thioredoxin
MSDDSGSSSGSAASTGSTALALALVLLLLAGVAGLSRVFRPSAGGLLGGSRDAPDFALPVVANGGPLGEGVSTLKMGDLRGKAVLLDFWATWCEPCRLEAPIVDRVSRRWRDRGVVVVGVNTDRPDEGDPAAFARAHSLSYPIVRDTGGTAQRAYEVDTLPTLVVVSREGRIIAIRSGVTDDGELEKLIGAAL